MTGRETDAAGAPPPDTLSSFFSQELEPGEPEPGAPGDTRTSIRTSISSNGTTGTLVSHDTPDGDSRAHDSATDSVATPPGLGSEPATPPTTASKPGGSVST